MKKISIITTSRAEFGILEDLIKVLWKLKITWPSGLLFKFLFGSTKELFEESLF